MTTRRTIEDGRLFPAEDVGGGWAISAQGDKAGYACLPKERLDTLEEYDAVEVVITGPGAWPVDPTTIGLPDAIAAKFTEVGDCGPALGLRIGRDELQAIRKALLWAPANPNAGIPRGSVGWSGREVFHGGSAVDVEGMVADGIRMSRSTGGYFGHGFYVAEEEALARSNYADFAEDEDGPGAVLKLEVVDGARILDLRNGRDQKAWDESGLAAFLGRPDFHLRARQAGIDGVYDRSVGGLAIYSPGVLRVVGIVPSPDPDPAPPAPGP